MDGLLRKPMQVLSPFTDKPVIVAENGTVDGNGAGESKANWIRDGV